MSSTQQPKKYFLVFPTGASFACKQEAIGYAIKESKLRDGMMFHVENEKGEWVFKFAAA